MERGLIAFLFNGPLEVCVILPSTDGSAYILAEIGIHCDYVGNDLITATKIY